MARSLKFGLLGHNISYSKSPEIFNAIFNSKGINGSFETFDLSINEFEEEFQKIVGNGINGLSVTIPFKSRVMPLLNEISNTAKALNAVNSIAVKNNQLQGYNTDCTGFSIPLAGYMDKLKNTKALIIGNGGSARAVVYALHSDFKISQFIIVGRSQSRLKEFQNNMLNILPDTSIEILLDEMFDKFAAGEFGITVNCTPLGGWNYSGKSPLPKSFEWNRTSFYYDLNYNDNNEIVQAANNSGIITLDGSGMLVGQALRSFELWTGELADFNDIYAKVFTIRLRKLNNTSK